MYGNTPYAGLPDEAGMSFDTDQQRTLRRDAASIAARTRSLLPDEFVVGSEVLAGDDGLAGTVAVQPPIGGVVSGSFAPGDDATAREDLACELAAGAIVEVRQRFDAAGAPAK
jgi:hypothetical protein